ncbi:MAG: arylsulfatase [Verrucomicrobia bacterium]|nr:arylsulfatase [Verrucomicrobiota bacterium]
MKARFPFLSGAVLAGGLFLFAGVAPAAEGFPSKPNVVLILADDMGFSDAGCYGGEIRTPNLDRLAAEGLRFTQFYNTTRCWPTRGAVMTGYYAQQVRRDAVPGVRSGYGGRRPGWARLLPELLKPLGYRCYHSGKWHIDGPRLKGGFDRSYSLEDHNRFFAPKRHLLDDKPLPPVKPGSGYYATTAIASRAVEFLKEHARAHRQQPFFLYLCFTSPHFPLQAPAEDIARYRDKYAVGWDAVREARWKRLREMGLLRCDLSSLEPNIGPPYYFPQAYKILGPGEIRHETSWSELTEAQRKFQAAKMAVHAAMVDRMDQEIGRVLAQLRAMGAEENTVVFFLSDNGASAEIMVRGDGHDPNAPPGSARTFLCLGPGWSSAANTPFRRHKTWVQEGGIATPLIVRWPQGIRARGEFRRAPGHVVDLAPTILDLAGGEWPKRWAGGAVPPPPGKSLVPLFRRDGTAPHRFLWWLHEGNRAIRMGDWKLVADRKGPWELYNLAQDRSETRNLAARFPGRVKELAALWEREWAQIQELAKRDLPRPSGESGR